MDDATLWGMAVGSITAIAGAVAWATQFRTKARCDRIRRDCALEQMRQRDLEEVKRQEIWAKIDRMYEWMITGTIVIRRRGEESAG